MLYTTKLMTNHASTSRTFNLAVCVIQFVYLMFVIVVWMPINFAISKT